VVDAEVAVLANTLCVKGSINMFAFRSLLGPAFCVIAILAHSICVVWLIVMPAFCDLVSVLLLLNIFAPWQEFMFSRGYRVVLSRTEVRVCSVEMVKTWQFLEF
jgi:hypothetical protein